MNKCLIFILLQLPLLLSSRLSAQTTPEEITTHFFELYQSQGSDAAVDYVFSTNKWLNNEKTAVETIKAQLKKGIAIVGQYYGYDLIEKKSVTENFVMMSYLLRYDRQPLRFVFILYRPSKTWQIQTMKFDDRLDDDFPGEGQ